MNVTLYLPIAGKKRVRRQAAVSAVCCVTFKHNISIGSWSVHFWIASIASHFAHYIK